MYIFCCYFYAQVSLVVMGRSDKSTHDIPKILGKQPVDLVVGVVCTDTVVTVCEEMGLVAMVACKRQPVHQHKCILHMHIVYLRK